MMRVGIIGLGSSHALQFARRLENRNASVHGIVDYGHLREEEYIKSFGKRYGAQRYEGPAELAEVVDAAMVLTVDWRKHCELAQPLLRAGIPTLIDKPIAGSLTDIEKLRSTANNTGTALFGGSAVPYHPVFQKIEKGNANRMTYVVGYGYGHQFYYGAHVTDLAVHIICEPWDFVEPSDDPGQSVRVGFANGSKATLRFEINDSFAVLDISDQTNAIRLDPKHVDEIFDAYIDYFLRVCNGSIDAKTDLALNGASLLLASHEAIQTGERILTNSEKLRSANISASSFIDSYELPPSAPSLSN